MELVVYTSQGGSFIPQGLDFEGSVVGRTLEGLCGPAFGV